MIWLLIALLLIILYLVLIAPSSAHPDDRALRGWLYAHRGLHDGNQSVPENSLEAFRLAAENGYGIELDVQLTRDGMLVVHHDGTLKRVCGVDRKIRELTYAELCKIPLPDGSRVPLFSEVLNLVAGPTRGRTASNRLTRARCCISAKTRRTSFAASWPPAASGTGAK